MSSKFRGCEHEPQRSKHILIQKKYTQKREKTFTQPLAGVYNALLSLQTVSKLE
jgi:hypothetical protein